MGGLGGSGGPGGLRGQYEIVVFTLVTAGKLASAGKFLM